MPLLEVTDLRVGYDVYGGTLRVLNGVNFFLDEGERGFTTAIQSGPRLLAQI